MTANDSPVSTVLDLLQAVKRSGAGWIARCPAHTDGRHSLKIGVGDDGRALLHCYAGCDTAAIVEAIGLSMADIFARDASSVSYARSERITYDYHDSSGNVLFQEVRDPQKRFWLRHPDGQGGWTRGMDGVEEELYNLPELIARADETVLLVEGCKDAERLRELGFLATTAAKGANAPWLDRYTETLRGRSVMILADNDTPGTACARTRAQALQGIARRVKVGLLPDLPPKGDVSDWLDAGHTRDELIQIVEGTPDWTRETVAADPADHDPGRPWDDRQFGPTIIGAVQLMGKSFPPPRWAVEGIFAEGLSIFVGPPKIGKSWLALNIAAAVAHGGMAIGRIPVDGGDVLYLALEDTERRLQERLLTTLQGGTPPSRLDIATTWPSLADGASSHLRHWLQGHPDTRLVVVDTFAKIRGVTLGNQNLYAADYAAAGELKRVADDYGIALVMVHHTRKALADDPLDAVSGTTGLAGAADTILVLRKEIGRSDANLYIRGRDVPEADHALTFDPESCSWTLIGDAAIYRLSQERQDILTLLDESREPMSPKHIAEALGKNGGATRKLLYSMSRSGSIIGLGGEYCLPPGNTGNTGNARACAGSESVTGVTATHGAPTNDDHSLTPVVSDSLVNANARTGESPGNTGASVTTVAAVSGGRADPWPAGGEAGDDRWTA